MGLRRVGHDWASSRSRFTFTHWRRKRQPTPVFLPGEPQGRRSLVGCRLWGRTQSDTTEATWQRQQLIIYSTEHKDSLAHRPLCAHTVSASRAAALLPVTAVSMGHPWEDGIQRACCSGCCVNRERTLAWPPCHSGERLHFVRLCYRCCISHERINLSVVPMAPQVFCQPLSLHSVYANSAHSEIQLDSAAYKLKSSTAGVVGLQDTQRAGEPGAPLDGGSRWPSYSMWCRVAAVFLVWAPVED